MEKNNKLIKGFCEFSIILFCLSILVFCICFPALELSGNENYIALSLITSLLLAVSSLLILASAIILIVKICSNHEVSSTDKILWGIFLYFTNLFVIPFAINKFIIKSDDYNYAKKYLIFEIVTLSISILSFIFIFCYLMSLMNF